MTFRTGSFCSGIAAPEVAWAALGWRPVFFSEIEPFPCAVLAARHPGVPNLGDMTQVSGEQLRGSIDVLVAGTPCQAFSVAGKRGSLCDHRGNLTLTFVELVHDILPRWVVWENVPGVLSTKDNAFGCFLAGLVGEGEPLVCGDGSWSDAGMVIGPERSAAWRVLDAQYFKLAQRRRRVFVVSCRTRDGINPGAVLFEPESLPRDSAPRREAGERVAGTFAAGAHPGSYNGQDAYSGSLIPSVSLLLLGKHNSSHDVEKETYVTHSLRADGFDASEDGTGRGTPLVPTYFSARLARNSHTSNQVGIKDDGLSDALSTDGPGAIAFDTTQITSAGNYSNPKPGDPCHPLASGAHPPAVAFQERGREGGRSVESQTDLAYSLMAPSGGGRRQENNVAAGMAVRRLTPLECERLQGFPDCYTLIPMGRATRKAVHDDFARYLREQHAHTYPDAPPLTDAEIRVLAADGPRYRALGNSMAVPVLRWIGERIAKVEEAIR